MIQHAKMFPKKDRKLIINGDFLDVEHLMKGQESFKKFASRADGIEDFFLPESEAEFNWGNERLDELQKIFSEIIFISGNHDWRYDWFKESKHCPSAYAANFDLRVQLALGPRGIKFVQYNDWLDIGNFAVTHGAFHGTTSHKKHYEACGKSCIFGHIHKNEVKSFAVRGETKTVWSLPAMCDLNPAYMKNLPNNWDNGYATCHMRYNGSFNMHTHVIIKGETVFPDGTIIKA